MKRSVYTTKAGLGIETAREASGAAWLGTGTARTLLTEANASAAETEVIMREKENIAGT